VFDRIDAGIRGGDDALGPVHMRRHRDAVQPRFLDDCADFVGEPWDDRLLEHAGTGSPFRNVTTFAQNPEGLEPVNTRAISR